MNGQPREPDVNEIATLNWVRVLQRPVDERFDTPPVRGQHDGEPTFAWSECRAAVRLSCRIRSRCGWLAGTPRGRFRPRHRQLEAGLRQLYHSDGRA